MGLTYNIHANKVFDHIDKKMLDVRVLVLLHSNAHKLVNLISNSHHS